MQETGPKVYSPYPRSLECLVEVMVELIEDSIP